MTQSPITLEFVLEELRSGDVGRIKDIFPLVFDFLNPEVTEALFKLLHSLKGGGGGYVALGYLRPHSRGKESMKRLILLFIFCVTWNGCAVSGGGRSGTGLGFDKGCLPGQQNCCPPGTECSEAEKCRCR